MQDGQHEEEAAALWSASGSSKTSNETARVRWKPTAQQITILEHIFNSGTVNPPKHVTTNIRKQLEHFGPVEDVNIFYWFQNRRSRCSRRLRQMRTDSAAAAAAAALDPITCNPNNHINFEPSPQASFIPNIHMNSGVSSSSSSSVNMFPDTTTNQYSYMPNHPAAGMIPKL